MKLSFVLAQNAMGALHIIGGLILIYATQVSSSMIFIVTVLMYSLTYMPTVALSNNIVFANISDSGKTFPIIRFFGTFGWIVAGLIIGVLQLENNLDSISYTFYIAAAASILLGIFSFALPNVPPKGKSEDSALGLEGLVMLKDKSYLTIAGQTAPGKGITFTDRNLSIKNCSHIIARYFRVRLGDENKPAGTSPEVPFFK